MIARFPLLEGSQDTTDLTTSKPTLAGVDQTGGVVELDFDKSISDGVNIYANPEGFRGDFVFLARDTCLRRERKRYGRQAASRYIDNPDASGLVATKPELRKHSRAGSERDSRAGCANTTPINREREPSMSKATPRLAFS